MNGRLLACVLRINALVCWINAVPGLLLPLSLAVGPPVSSLGSHSTTAYMLVGAAAVVSCDAECITCCMTRPMLY